MLTGAKEVWVKQAGATSGMKVYPRQSSISELANGAVEIQKMNNSFVLEYNGNGNLRFSEEQLPSLLAWIPASDPYSSLIVTGIMPIFLASAVIIHAHKIGWRDICYWSPVNSGIYGIAPELRLIGVNPVEKKDHFIVGVVGDPNSGKSVFTEMLESAGKKCFRKIWAYDCDYAAPTPKWYLQMLQSGQKDNGNELRRKYKRDWSHEAEQSVVNTLNNLRRHRELTLADLPGGIHKKNEPPERGIRIPKGREIIMKAVDFFIIVNRPDRNSVKYWKEDLSKIGKGDRILMTVHSEAPDAELSLTFSDPENISMTGLSREHAAPGDELYARLWNAFERAMARKMNKSGV